jgi:hypothetical protein
LVDRGDVVDDDGWAAGYPLTQAGRLLALRRLPDAENHRQPPIWMAIGTVTIWMELSELRIKLTWPEGAE